MVNIQSNINFNNEREEEQNNLDTIYNKIEAYKAKLKIKINKEYENIEISKDNGIDKEIDVQRHKYNINIYKGELEELDAINIDVPYSFHINCDFKDNGENEHLFYGEDDIKTDDSTLPLVFSWKHPSFVEFNNAVDNHRDELVDKIILLYRRVFIDDRKIKDVKTFINKLGGKEYVDFDQSIDQELILIKSNNKSIDSSLITTISKQQFEIVKNENIDDTIVQGCAGSGKTVIMLHKLSNYLYQKKDNESVIKGIKILTPSTYMAALYNDIARILKLNQIRYFTIEEYYIELLKNYNNKFDIKNAVLDEKKMDEEFLKYIYEFGGSDLVSEINYEIESLNLHKVGINNDDVLRWSDLHVKIANIIEKKLYGTESSDRSKYKEDMQSLTDIILDKIEENKKRIIANNRNIEKVRKYLSDILLKKDNKKTDDELTSSNSKKLIDNLQLIKDFEQKVLNDYFDNRLERKYSFEIEFSSANNVVPTEDKKEKIRNIIENFSAEELIYRKEYLINNVIKNKEVFESLQKIESSLEVDDEFILGIIKNYFKNNYKFNERSDYFCNILLAYIKTNYIYLLDYKVDEFCKSAYETYDLIYEPHIYRFKLFLYLTIAYKYYGEKQLDSYINIDEGQDYSPNEIMLLKRALGEKCRFDIYGDLNQTLQNYRRVVDWKSIDFVDYDNIYELNYNYRNTEEIIDFVNKKTGMDIQSIHLRGDKVETYNNLQDAINGFYNFRTSFFDSQDRSKQTYAIILSIYIDIDEFKEMIRTYLQLENVDDFSFGYVDFDKISVIDISTAKGLEFSSVLVIDDDLTMNQLYVALTRATKHLFYFNEGVYEKTSEEKTKQLDLIKKIMEENGGTITYEILYKEYENKIGRKIGYGVKAGIRKNIETHSSDSKGYISANEDIFYKKGYGCWGLRK